MEKALGEYVIIGPPNNLEFCKTCVRHPKFQVRSITFLFVCFVLLKETWSRSLYPPPSDSHTNVPSSSERATLCCSNRQAGGVDTAFIEEHETELLPELNTTWPAQGSDAMASVTALGALAVLLENDGGSTAQVRAQTLTVTLHAMQCNAMRILLTI